MYYWSFGAKDVPEDIAELVGVTQGVVSKPMLGTRN